MDLIPCVYFIIASYAGMQHANIENKGFISINEKKEKNQIII